MFQRAGGIALPCDRCVACGLMMRADIEVIFEPIRKNGDGNNTQNAENDFSIESVYVCPTYLKKNTDNRTEKLSPNIGNRDYRRI